MFEGEIKEALAKALNKDKEAIALETPPKSELGDLAFPCFSLASEWKKNPNEIAKEIAEKIKSLLPKEVSINVIGAYVNFFIEKGILAETIINEALIKKDKYGSSNLGGGKKILVEHTSINPNSPPHIGHARGALIGSSIVKILKFQNYKPEVHYYINDVSKQVALLALVTKGKEKFSSMLKLYVKAAKRMEKNKEFEAEVFKILKQFEEYDTKTVKKIKNIVDTCTKGQLKILAKLGIEHDFFDYESAYLKNLDNLIKELEKTNKLFRDESSRLILDQHGNGFDSDMKEPLLVLTRSDGTGLYALRDIAYTIDKLKRADKNIIVLGEEHKLYFKQLSAALSLLGYPAPRAIYYSHVLIEGEQGRQRMSKRAGKLVLLEDFIDECIKKAKKEIKKRKSRGDAEAIGLAALKYAILKTEENKNVIFDWKGALNFEGNSGPYLQYTYARASSILRKAKEIRQNRTDLSLLQNEKEIWLIKSIANFPDVCRTAAEHFQVHNIAVYSYELAQAFNNFYESCPVLKAEKERDARLMLVRAARQTLGNALSLLGIKPLERM